MLWIEDNNIAPDRVMSGAFEVKNSSGGFRGFQDSKNVRIVKEECTKLKLTS